MWFAPACYQSKWMLQPSSSFFASGHVHWLCPQLGPRVLLYLTTKLSHLLVFDLCGSGRAGNCCSVSGSLLWMGSVAKPGVTGQHCHVHDYVCVPDSWQRQNSGKAIIVMIVGVKICMPCATGSWHLWVISLLVAMWV